MDLQQAYDSVRRMGIGKILQECRIPVKLITLLEVTMKDTISCIQVQGEIGDFLKENKGLKQGDGLPQLLFNLILEYVMTIVRISMQMHVFI